MKQRPVLIILITIVIIIFVIYEANLIWRLDRISSNPNPAIRHFATAWRSLKRTIDLPFAALGLLVPNSYPTYSLTIDPQDYQLLLRQLPNYPTENYLSERFKDTAPAYFTAEEFSTEADVRFRGVSPQHWTNYKKSWHIEFPPDKLFNGQHDLRLIIPEDRKWTAEFLNQYRAEKLGLISPEMQFVWLFVNGERMGLYTEIEGWETELLERTGRPSMGEIFSPRDIPMKGADYLRASALPFWESRFDPEAVHTNKKFLELLSLISSADNTTFYRDLPQLFDLEKFYRWELVNLLAASTHQSNIENMNFYWNLETQKFEPISFDVSLEPLFLPLDTRRSPNRLTARILQNPEWKKGFEEVVHSYVAGATNLQVDLQRFDAFSNDLRWQVFKDNKKAPTNFEFLRENRENRNVIENNFMHVQKVLREGEKIEYVFP